MGSEESPAMSGDELAAVLFAERGYVVAATFSAYGIGEIINDTIVKVGGGSPAATPLRVTGPSTEQEALEQAVRMAELLGVPAKPARRPFYYRVEAAD